MEKEATIVKYEYEPKGVCSSKMIFDIEGEIVRDVTIVNGCPGNTLAVSVLCKNKSIDEIIKLLYGIPCRNRGTSCPDQLAKALIEYKKQNNG